MRQKILILDFGSQHTQQIARLVRAAGVYCEIYPGDIGDEFIREQVSHGGVKGIILSGSYTIGSSTEGAGASIISLEDKAAIQASPSVFLSGVPVLGICYGMHLMAHHLGGQVQMMPQLPYDFSVNHVAVQGINALFAGLSEVKTSEGEPQLEVWMSLARQITELPVGFKVIGRTRNCPIAAIADEDRRFYGVQFHPEVAQSKQGEALLQRFALDICGCDGEWNMADYADELIDRIRETVGDDRVILALSGGVDSSVAAVLIHRAIGRQLSCVFVDHGLLRLYEGKQVMDVLNEHLGVNIIHVNAEQQFLSALKGVDDPEQKRKIIGAEFIKVFEHEATKLGAVDWLAQGTIYPDVIESAGGKDGKGVAVKSHHNVGGLPDTMNMQLLEPLRELFKDEVRQLGVALGLPERMVYRHPFPGPGLGVRILGEIKQDYADILRRADAIFIDELRSATDSVTGKNWYDRVSQAFAVFLPVKSVGVTGEGRAYDYVIALRAVQTIDFMTAQWAPLPHELLGHIANRIITEVPGVSRVVYDISGKPPATIEWE